MFHLALTALKTRDGRAPGWAGLSGGPLSEMRKPGACTEDGDELSLAEAKQPCPFAGTQLERNPGCGDSSKATKATISVCFFRQGGGQSLESLTASYMYCFWGSESYLHEWIQ